MECCSRSLAEIVLVGDIQQGKKEQLLWKTFARQTPAHCFLYLRFVQMEAVWPEEVFFRLELAFQSILILFQKTRTLVLLAFVVPELKWS